MKIRMLVGACGLALAGSAFGVLENKSTPDFRNQLEKLDVRVGHELTGNERRDTEGGTPFGRSLASGAARGPAFVFRDTYDGLDADQLPPQDGPGQYIRVQGFLNPAQYQGDFSLDNQLNPDNQGWGSDDSPNAGISDQSTAMSNMDGDPSNGEYVGPAAGPDPMNMRGGLFHVQRASIAEETAIDPGFIGTWKDVFTNLYTGTPSQPLFVEMDIYKNTHREFQRVQFQSFGEGSNIQVMQTGGTTGGGFDGFSTQFGDPDLIEGWLALARDPDDPTTAPLVYGQHIIPENGWYTVGWLTDSTNYQAVFIRDSSTTADTDMNGTPDFVMPINTMTGMRMFTELGYGLEEGWVQIVPGTQDDPMTPEIEGVGVARDFQGEPVSGVIDDGSGNTVGEIVFGISLDFYRIWRGDDESEATVTDWWHDDFRIRGIQFVQPDPIPTYRIPYFDDLERWNLGRMALQGGRWAELPGARITVSDAQNSTLPGEATVSTPPTQSLLWQNRRLNNIFQGREFETALPTVPRVRGEVGDPAVIEVDMRVPSPFVTMMIRPIDQSQAVSDTAEFLGQFLTSATDANLIPDGQAYVRQRKPLGTDVANGEFDETLAPVPVSGPNLVPAEEADINTEFINVEANPSGAGSFNTPVNSFFTVRFEVEPDPMAPAANGDDAILRVFVNGTELFPNGNAAENFTARTITADAIFFGSGNDNAAGFSNIFTDDIFFDGPTDSLRLVDPATGELADAQFADDPAWELPFADGLDTYQKDRPVPGQGFVNHRLGFMPVGDPGVNPIPNDWDEIEFVEGAQSLTPGVTEVVAYTIESIDQGAGLPFTVGDTVAVSLENVFSEYDPDDNIYGRINDGENDPTEWYILDSLNGSEIARGTWFLAFENTDGRPNGVDVYDASWIDFGAQFSYRVDPRFTGASSEALFVDAAAEGVDVARGSRGDVARLLVTGNVNFDEPNQVLRQNAIGMFSILMPVAQTEGSGDEAVMTYEVYVGQDRFETGFWAVMPGATIDGGEITALGFGGKGYVSGNDVNGLTPFLGGENGINTFAFRKANPLGGGGNPQFIWEDTGVPVPTEEWIQVEARVNNDSEWSISVNNSVIATGVAGDASDPSANTNSFDSLTFVRNQFGDFDGAPTSGDIQWTARAFDAPAPTGGDIPDEYHGYRIDFILSGEMNLPQIWPVDQQTGTPDVDGMGMPMTRPLDQGDIVLLVNEDPSTGQPYDQQFTNFRWELLEDDGMGGFNSLSRGTWEAIGLPGAAGQGTGQEIFGGVGNGNTPPYNTESPFQTILLGDYVAVQDSQVLPSDKWYVDNITLDLEGNNCPTDLTGDGTVGAGDLAILIGNWGQVGVPGDFDGDGVDAGDLALLIGTWGNCP